MFTSGKQGVNSSKRDIIKGVCIWSFPEHGTCCGYLGGCRRSM